MKQSCVTAVRRVLAAAMVLLLGLGLPASAAGADIPPAWDETYYATLDYYGGLMDSSVVKSVRTYGNEKITDYGVYDEIINLTDNRQASVSGGRVTFDLSGDVPNKFYFEGKTRQPYEQFPWTLSMSYALNGVPARAEELAGKSGLVEITLDAVPSLAASEYSRNNLVLTAMSMFNGDDILSLDAPGAQVQLVGNLYCVLYAVLPGEEQHFTIRVGTEDFSYTGMIFLAVPATLQQLEQVADLREAKEKVEDSYHALNDSLDVILNTLEGMSGSLNATANGLDQLNRARETISNGKAQVYDSLDIALEAAGPLTESMKPMAGHLATAQQALTETKQLLNEMNSNVVGLRPEVENTRKILKNLQSDLDELQELMDDIDDYPDDARRIAKDLSDDFDRLGRSANSLGSDMKELNSQLSGLQNQIKNLPNSSQSYVPVNGKDPRTVYSSIQTGQGLYQQYSAYSIDHDTDFDSYLVEHEGYSLAKAQELIVLLQYAQDEEFQEQLKQAIALSELLTKTGMSVNDLKSGVNAVVPPAKNITTHLGALCTALDGANLSGDLERLSDLLEDLMDDIDDHSGTLSSAAGTLKSAAELAIRVSENADIALNQLEALDGILNTYEPQLQQALTDAQTFTDSASTSISALVDAARSAEGLLKSSGSDLDGGSQQALTGLAAALRQSTRGLSQTGVIRMAKDTIDSLITDEWDSHTGGENNLLLMDAGAKPQSLTDSRNDGTASIQYVMRSQEIKADEDEQAQQEAAAQADQGTVWTRIVDMFRDLWSMITGIFKH